MHIHTYLYNQQQRVDIFGMFGNFLEMSYSGRIMSVYITQKNIQERTSDKLPTKQEQYLETLISIPFSSNVCCESHANLQLLIAIIKTSLSLLMCRQAIIIVFIFGKFSVKILSKNGGFFQYHFTATSFAMDSRVMKFI